VEESNYQLLLSIVIIPNVIEPFTTRE